MSEWLVELKGAEKHLRALTSQFRSTLWNVLEREGAFYIRSTLFDPLGDATEVRTTAISLVQSMKGAVNFESGWSLEIDVTGKLRRINDQGQDEDFANFKKITWVSSSTAIKVSLEQLMDLAFVDPNIADALRYFSYHTNRWWNLYKVFEVIGRDLGGQHHIRELGWATKREISRFTLTSQSPAVLGDAARHAVQKEHPPDDPMSPHEAEMFVRGLLSEWLNLKSG